MLVNAFNKLVNPELKIWTAADADKPVTIWAQFKRAIKMLKTDDLNNYMEQHRMDIAFWTPAQWEGPLFSMIQHGHADLVVKLTDMYGDKFRKIHEIESKLFVLLDTPSVEVLFVKLDLAIKPAETDMHLLVAPLRVIQNAVKYTKNYRFTTRRMNMVLRRRSEVREIMEWIATVDPLAHPDIDCMEYFLSISPNDTMWNYIRGVLNWFIKTGRAYISFNVDNTRKDIWDRYVVGFKEEVETPVAETNVETKTNVDVPKVAETTVSDEQAKKVVGGWLF